MSDEYRKQLDTSMPSTERQVELEAAYAEQQATDPPYNDIEIRTHGELQWIMQQRHWSGAYPLPTGMQRANLSGANFDEANLRKATLREANLHGEAGRHIMTIGTIGLKQVKQQAPLASLPPVIILCCQNQLSQVNMQHSRTKSTLTSLEML